MLLRVSRFGAEHAASFPSETLAQRSFAAVAEAASALEQHAVTQASASSEGQARTKAVARTRLRGSLRIIGRTARAFVIDAPGVVCKFRVPKTNGDHALLRAARAFARYARELETAFVEHGLSPAFLDDLDAEATRFEQASGDYRAVKLAGVGATAGVDAELARALAAVRRLDVIVANVFRDDRPVLAIWQQARRVGLGRRSAASESAAAIVPLRLATNVA
jgi:hypothetical protein